LLAESVGVAEQTSRPLEPTLLHRQLTQPPKCLRRPCDVVHLPPVFRCFLEEALRTGKVAFRGGQHPQAVQRHRHSRARTDLARDGEAFVQQFGGNREVTLDPCNVAEPAQRIDQSASMSYLPPDRQALLEKSTRIDGPPTEQRYLAELREHARGHPLIGELARDPETLVVRAKRRGVIPYHLCAQADLDERPANELLTNDGKDLYATNEGATQLAQGTLSKLDAQTGGLVWEYEIGARPSEVLVRPDRKTAYVSVRNDHKVRVLDISGDAPRLIGETAIGVQPDTMQITNDGTTLVVGLRSIPQMALMDTDSLAVRHVTFPGYGISGHEWLSANGKYTYIALESLDTTKPGAIGVVANASAEIVDIWTYPGGPWPHGVFYEPRVLGGGR